MIPECRRSRIWSWTRLSPCDDWGAQLGPWVVDRTVVEGRAIGLWLSHIWGLRINDKDRDLLNKQTPRFSYCQHRHSFTCIFTGCIPIFTWDHTLYSCILLKGLCTWLLYHYTDCRERIARIQNGHQQMPLIRKRTTTSQLKLLTITIHTPPLLTLHAHSNVQPGSQQTLVPASRCGWATAVNAVGKPARPVWCSGCRGFLPLHVLQRSTWENNPPKQLSTCLVIWWLRTIVIIATTTTAIWTEKLKNHSYE